jgi:hypothetical protein
MSNAREKASIDPNSRAKGIELEQRSPAHSGT